jgi:hypothetical protein
MTQDVCLRRRVLNTRNLVPNATPVTVLVWPVSGSLIGVLVVGSHSRTVLSLLPEASSSRPSSLVPNATPVTSLV